MALVSGETASSFAELNTTPYTEFSNGCAATDSDDDYAYVSSLAEQIAHALVLDDDDDPPARLAEPSNSLQQELWCREGTPWPSASLRMDKAELELKNTEVMCSVSHFAAAWRDNGPTEWDCFYTPSPQQASKNLSTLYTTQLDSKHYHLFQGLNSARLANNKQMAACAPGTWHLRSQEAHSTAYIVSSPARKESIGTGVFLPKIVNSAPHYRRKAGFSSSKSMYAPRHKC